MLEPAERARQRSGFADNAKTAAYPVEELNGMLFAYLGPEPRPLLPRWDGFVAEGSIRMLGRALIPINWLQAMENSLDPIHTEWLHGHTYEFVKEQEGAKVAISARHEKIAFNEFAYGITKHRLLAGHSEDSDDWRIGHPVVFPNMLSVGNGDENSRYYAFQIRVPVDDTHTMHLWYTAYMPPKGVAVSQHLLDKVHVYEVPWQDENGEFIVDNIDGQDMMAWITQGAIADRTNEHLGGSDEGVAFYRKMLAREIKKVERGQGSDRGRSATPRATSASTCRTNARSIITATALRAGSCGRMRPIRRSPRISSASSKAKSPVRSRGWPHLRPADYCYPDRYPRGGPRFPRRL